MPQDHSTATYPMVLSAAEAGTAADVQQPVPPARQPQQPQRRQDLNQQPRQWESPAAAPSPPPPRQAAARPYDGAAPSAGPQQPVPQVRQRPGATAEPPQQATASRHPPSRQQQQPLPTPSPSAPAAVSVNRPPFAKAPTQPPGALTAAPGPPAEPQAVPAEAPGAAAPEEGNNVEDEETVLVNGRRVRSLYDSVGSSQHVMARIIAHVRHPPQHAADASILRTTTPHSTCDNVMVWHAQSCGR